ncbi:hypothetical protein LCGC14_1415890 [marine sediment metagenome]|uniref:Major tropism determinant N-terminal domain-containing protein n=1 Tax=marine sediment metagenome TaxID=412755 RepID=A0A0F9MUK9_9ZZZZ
MALNSKLKIVGIWNETYTGDLAPTVKVHKEDNALSMVSGVANGEADEVWSDDRTATATADPIDLGALTSADGRTIVFAEITQIYIRNKSIVSGEKLIVGAGSNPLLNWVSATGDAVEVGPSGRFLIESPIDGYAVTDSTGDVLTVDPGAATIAYRIVVTGRSS